jgi:PAS domain S-box-containing protein
MKVLIANASENQRSSLEKLLNESGYQTISATNGVEALEWLRREPLDMIISDTRLPVLDGFELCAVVKNDVELQNIPFLFYTASDTSKKDKAFARSLGAQRFIVRPVDAATLMDIVNKVPTPIREKPAEARFYSSEEEIISQRTINEWLTQSLAAKSRQLRDTEEKLTLLKTAVEQAAELIALTDRYGTIQYVNPAFEKITGYTREELIGENPRILKSGRQDDMFYKEMWNTISRGQRWHGFFINRKKDGSFYTEEATIIPVKHIDGRIKNFVTVKRDMTEESRLEGQLIQSQKMEAIGTLAGGIAHDFNNILSAILGYAELAMYDLPEESRSQEDVTEIIQAGNRARDLVRQILTFSRKTEQEFKPININPLINEALKFLRASLPSTIEIRPDIRSESADVMCNPTQIQQVLMNLCTNAAQAMKDTGGNMFVSLCGVTLKQKEADKHPDLHPGRYICLTVNDTGPGIDPDILDRIFDPYFTTKDKGEGTGLGLSVVHGIVKTLNGALEVKSSPGKGTTFHIYFPRADIRTESAAEKTKALPTGSEKILLVDDEKTLAKMGRLMLERLGYDVITCTSSREALETFQTRPQDFDLVISDKTMPEMTGFDLAAQLKITRPDIPVIVCTGYSEDIEVNRAAGLGISRLLMKPLSLDDLANAVREVLDVARRKNA